MRFAAVQYDIAWEDKAANHATIERMLEEATPPIAPGTFVVLPELGDTGFSFNLDKIVDGATLPWAQKLAKRLGIWLQSGYAVRGDDGKGRNCAAIVSSQGEVVGIYQKVHPFSYGQEIEHFSGGSDIVVRCAGEAIVSPMICYDLRFPELWRHAALSPSGEGAEVFTIGACWPSARQRHWRNLLIARAIENQAYVVAANRIGSEPRVRYAGGSIIVSAKGDVLAEAGDEPIVLQAEVDLEAARQWRAIFPALRDVRRKLLGLDDEGRSAR